MTVELELYRFEGSANCERVEMALRFLGLPCRLREIDRDGSRREVQRVSGQHLVPVLVHGERVVPDSTAILEYLDSLRGSRPLYPRSHRAAATCRTLVDWFNAVWKRPMNALLDALAAPSPDPVRIEEEIAALDRNDLLVEGWLERRTFLCGNDAPTAADFAFYPFLKHIRGTYPPLYESWDRFATLVRGRGTLPNLEAWLARMHPYAAAEGQGPPTPTPNP